MAHELFCCLLGFSGDVFVEDESTFRVRDGFDLLTQAERDQLNRLSPLGWFYKQLTNFVNKHEITWGGGKVLPFFCVHEEQGAPNNLYLTAIGEGVADFLVEYVADITCLEQLIISDGPVPLSKVLQHLHKVTKGHSPLSILNTSSHIHTCI